jgi:uncharacterized membrane protein
MDEEPPRADAEGGEGTPEEPIFGEVIDSSGETQSRSRTVAGELTVAFRESSYPSPDDLAVYERIHPGFTDRILSLTERETDHRIAREDKQDDATIVLAKRGQLFAFVIVMTLTVGAIVAILTGHSIVGIAAIVVAAATLAGSFIAPRIFVGEDSGATRPGAEISGDASNRTSGE